MEAKDEFIKRYCEASGVTWEWLSKYQVVLPCYCKDADPEPHWAMVSNDPDLIADHMRFYGQARIGVRDDLP